MKTTLSIQIRLAFTICAAAMILWGGCNNTSNHSTNHNEGSTKISESVHQHSSIPFVDSTLTIDSNKPFKIWSYRMGKGKVINRNTFDLLQLEHIYHSFNSAYQYTLFGNINFSEDFNTLVFQEYDNERYASIKLVTYDLNYHIIDSLRVYQSDNKMGESSISSYIHSDKIYLEYLLLDRSIEYGIDSKGKFNKSNRPVTFKHYIYVNELFGGQVHNMPTRNVKAKSGLIIRDSLGKSIGKLDFGEIVHIVGYTKDTISIKDEEKVIKGVKAKIILNKNSVQTGKDFYVSESNIGYVFTGFLYGDNYSPDDDDSHYAYDDLTIGKGQSTTVDLREVFNIDKVNIQSYTNRILKRPEVSFPALPVKNGKILTLPFENGKELVLTDTTFQSEYTPTLSYGVSFHPDFKDAYLVGESMFFMNNIYTLISRKTGDTLHVFTEYPYLSPNRKYIVSIFPDWTECNQDTYVNISILNKNDQYENYAGVAVNSWSYPFKLGKNGNPIDDFSIYWLADNEFIIKVKNPEECDLGETIESFYLKYKIK